MRKTIVLPAIASFAAAVSLAGRIAVSPLAPSSFADAETSTNVAISAWSGSRTFTVDLTLDATASNGVEIAVGSDASPHDGRLSAAEAALCFGWDGGHWFLETPGLTNRIEVSSSAAAGQRRFRLELAVRPDGSARALSIHDGDAPILADVAVALPAASDWNLVRATTRGRDPAHESVVVRSFPDKTQVFVR